MKLHLFLLVCIILLFCHSLYGQSGENSLDERVRAFLENKNGQWNDWNIPERDGRLLYDLIVENNYQNALEIGTSTGYSAIWIAWALSKTGGKLITIEIDESRHNEAVANFEAAGLSAYIDARLADAHELVPRLEGPFDFIFCDADKSWYKNYFTAADPKLQKGGCFAAHNISRNGGMAPDFYNYVKELPGYETSVNTEGGGMSLSYKREE